MLRNSRADAVPSTADELRALIHDELRRSRAPGCAVTVVCDGQVMVADGFGLRDVDTGAPVTRDTRFPIASVTKCFTGGLCASLASDGLLDLDRPIRDYRPGFRLSDPVATALLSIRDCLTHRSGVPRHDAAWYIRARSESRDRLTAALAHLPPSRPFRQEWQYNNLLYMAAGEVAAEQIGLTYEQAVMSRLLQPLAMNRTSFSVADIENDPDHATPYVVSEGGPREVPFAPNDVIGAAGCMISTAHDMSQWVSALVGPTDGGHPLSGSALDEMLSPAIRVPGGATIADSRVDGYGLGLSIGDYRGLRIAEHGGNIDGFTAQLVVVPSRHVGVTVLCNGNDSWLAEALGYMLLDVALGLEPLPHGRRAKDRAETLRRGAQQASTRQAAASTGRRLPVPLREYAGEYQHPGYGSVRVTEHAGSLIFDYAGHASRLEHRDLEVFDLMLLVGAEERRVPAQFLRDLHSDIETLLLGLEPALPPLRFDRVPDLSRLTSDHLARLTGDFRLDQITATVTRGVGQTLILRVTGLPPQILTPADGTTFTTGFDRVEFTKSGQMLTPLGDFTRVDEREHAGDT